LRAWEIEEVFSSGDFRSGVGKDDPNKLRELNHNLPEEFVYFPPIILDDVSIFWSVRVVTISLPHTIYRDSYPPKIEQLHPVQALDTPSLIKYTLSNIRRFMLRTTKIQTLSLPPEMVKEIEKLAKEENMTKSELFREALREYLRRKRWEKIREYGARKAAELGIKEEDVEKMIDEYRAEKVKIAYGQSSS